MIQGVFQMSWSTVGRPAPARSDRARDLSPTEMKHTRRSYAVGSSTTGISHEGSLGVCRVLSSGRQFQPRIPRISTNFLVFRVNSCNSWLILDLDPAKSQRAATNYTNFACLIREIRAIRGRESLNCVTPNCMGLILRYCDF